VVLTLEVRLALFFSKTYLVPQNFAHFIERKRKNFTRSCDHRFSFGGYFHIFFGLCQTCFEFHVPNTLSKSINRIYEEMGVLKIQCRFM